jgi:hypothetical protein
MSMPPPLPRPTPERLEDNPGMRVLLPVGRSAFAIAAGYLGLVAVLVLPAPAALICGVLAIRDIRRSRGTAQPKYGMGRAVFGIAMGGLFTLLLLGLIVGAVVSAAKR